MGNLTIKYLEEEKVGSQMRYWYDIQNHTYIDDGVYGIIYNQSGWKMVQYLYENGEETDKQLWNHLDGLGLVRPTRV